MYWKTFHDCFTTSLEITCRLLKGLLFLSSHPGFHSEFYEVTSDSKGWLVSLSAFKNKKFGLMPKCPWAVLSSTTAYVNIKWVKSQRNPKLSSNGASFLYCFPNLQTMSGFCAVFSLNLNNIIDEQGKCAANTVGGNRHSLKINIIN